MKPASFEYVAASCADEAVETLAKFGEGAKILAGGQSLVPLMNMRLARPGTLVDINPALDLAYVREGPSDGVRLGSTVRQRAMEHHSMLRERYPLLADVARLIGHAQIRNRATVLGSIAHADPAAELPAVALLLDATLTLRSARGSRCVPARDFFVAYLTTLAEPDELLVEMQLPRMPWAAGWGVDEVSRRHGDFAMAGAVALLVPGADGLIREARLALFGVGATPMRVPTVERWLVGQPSTTGVIHEAAETVLGIVEPESDLHASATYRRALAATVAERALLKAARTMGRNAS